MTRLACLLRIGICVGGLTVAAMSVGAPLAAASGSAVPFTDPNAHGTLTFCNRAGAQMTSGSLYTAPFAWKTVSSTPAPAGYRRSDGRATLLVYQPIKFVDPGDWSGEALTGSSSFSSAAHPVDQATNADQPLLGFTQAYPAHWDGLVQVRMYYSGFNKPQETSSYPAAVLKISGSTWTLVSGGGASCSAGKGVSDETQLLPKSRLATPQSILPSGVPTPGATGSSGDSTVGGSSDGSKGSSSSSGSTSKDTDTAAAAELSASSSSGMSSASKLAIGLGVVAVLALIGGGLAWWRRATGGTP